MFWIGNELLFKGDIKVNYILTFSEESVIGIFIVTGHQDQTSSLCEEGFETKTQFKHICDHLINGFQIYSRKLFFLRGHQLVC